MDVREKLVELLCKMISPTITVGEQADFLIANGVTVQKWHSVGECMPEDLEENKGKKVINCIVEHNPYENGKTTAQFRQRKYDKYSDRWYWSKIGGCTVIRWTMMPQPPKGE